MDQHLSIYVFNLSLSYYLKSKVMRENTNKIKQFKKTIMQQMKALKPASDATPQQAIEALVRQAEYYTNYLLSRHELIKKQAILEEKKRGHFEVQEQEEQHIIDEEQDAESQIFTRLTEQPSILKGGVLKYYQLVGLNWMISLYESGINGILADDMGLGKTIQTIAIIAFLRQFNKIKGPHIIIAPKITLGNWVNQFQKWLPDCQVVKLIATKDEREEILSQQVNNGKFDVLITSFQGVRICLSSLKKIKWHYIVIDEAHKIKNEDSQLSQVVRKLHTQCKLLLTGTPLQNNLHQLWSLLNFLLPQIFTTSQMFDNWFSNAGTQDDTISPEEVQKRNAHMIHQLHKILKPFMLRRTKLEVQKSLPPKKQVHIYVGLTDCQLKVYKNLLQNRTSSQDEKKFYLNLLMQLRKVCNHPYLFPGIEEEGAPVLGEHLIENSGKLIVLDRLLKKLYSEKSHKILIFSQMTMVLDIIEDYCNYRQFKYCRIDGSTDMDLRDSQIQDFMRQDSDRFIFLLSTRAGGLGINLTAADTVIIYDSDWNPQMDLQAMDRAHRIGQKNPVNVYRLITENTVEQKIIQRQTIKLKWDSLVIQQAKTTQKNRALTKQQMKDMLQFGASVIIKANQGTITDEEIDVILARGQSKTNALNKEVEEKLNVQNKNISDLSMNSINIFDFMMHDQFKKKQDQLALDQLYARQLQEKIGTRREKLKNINYTVDLPKIKKENNKIEKKIYLPEYHFYQNKQRLQDLLQKEEDYNTYRNVDKTYEPLTPQEEEQKKKLIETGFRDWSKNDFNNFVSACDKFGRKNIQSIAGMINKSIEDVTLFSQTFWARIDQLPQKDKIIKQIQSGEERIQNRKNHLQLLQWKASQCYQIDFNPQVYTKFKSKLFSIDADRFLAQNLYKLGITNMIGVKQKIRTQPMFRFDHYFRSRTESELNKRMQSIYRLIEKEKDNINFGIDVDLNKQVLKKQKNKKKMEEKERQKQKQSNIKSAINISNIGNSRKNVVLISEDDQNQGYEGQEDNRIPKERQSSLMNFIKIPNNNAEPINIEDDPQESDDD